MGCVVEATRQYLVDQGLPPNDVATASTEVLSVALEKYVEICKKSDPEGTDAALETFKHLMEHGHWPNWATTSSRTDLGDGQEAGWTGAPRRNCGRQSKQRHWQRRDEYESVPGF